jgi:hypothetical protein
MWLFDPGAERIRTRTTAKAIATSPATTAITHVVRWLMYAILGGTD